MVETPQEEKSYDSIDEMFEEFHKEDLEWKKKHPLRGYIREWLDNRFPNGIADYRAYHSLTHPWEILRYWKRHIVYAWQRVFRGWDDRAIWAIDMYLAKIIPEMTKQLKEITVGTPLDMFDGLPYEDENTYSYSKENSDIAMKRWHDILDNIAEGFEIYCQEGGDMQYYKDEENLRKNEKYQKAFDLLRKYFGSLGD